MYADSPISSAVGGKLADGSDVLDLSLKGYDYEGFREIIDRYGADWDKPYSRQMTMDDYWGKEAQDAD